jgi:HEAT repeat protein
MHSLAARRALWAGGLAALCGLGWDPGLGFGRRAQAAASQLVAAPDGALVIRDGQTVLARVELQTLALRRGTPRFREVEVDGHRVGELRLPVRGRAAEEVWIGELPAGARASTPARVIWSGITGARDADGEVATQVEIAGDRIVEYQTAAQVTRCDGEPPRLFPRAWDFTSRRFRPLTSALPPPAAQRLIARRGDPAMPTGRPLGGFRWMAASTTAAAGRDARALTAPLALNDGDPKTSWSEGLGGDGRGEFLTARAAAGGYGVRGLRIIPGDASSPAAFRARNRLRRFQLAFGPAPEQRFDVEIAGDPAADAAHIGDPYWVALPRSLPASCVTLTITEVTPGGEAAPPRNYGTTSIADLEVFTELDGPQGAARLVSDIAGGVDCQQRVPLLVNLGEPAVLPIAQAIATSGGIGRECLVEALTQLAPAPGSPAVTDALVGALAGASQKEEELVLAALQKAPAPPVGALAQLLGGKAAGGQLAALDDRVRAAHVLGALERPEAAGALLAAAGHGPDPLRLAVVKAIAGSTAVDPAALLAVLARAQEEPARYADLLRALVPAVRRRPESLPAALAALRGALDPARGFETRGRAVMAIGDLGASAGTADLAALRATSDDAVLRYLATRELAALGGPPGIEALRRALGDNDPRVRETAALGLGQHRDRSSGQSLIDGAKQEPWPFVRRAELEALGQLCVAGGGDLMIRAVNRDVDLVRRAALVGLVRCRDPRGPAVLLQTLGRHNEAATLRELAAALLGERGDRSAAAPLADHLRQLVNESEADVALEGVAASALHALGSLGGPAAVSSAVTLANDTRHPFRGVAIEALGTLCDPGAGAATLQGIAGGADAVAAAAAQTAQRRCAKK